MSPSNFTSSSMASRTGFPTAQYYATRFDVVMFARWPREALCRHVEHIAQTGSARLMKTLLTGATGYLGLHILRELLQDGQQVTAVVRSPEKLGSFAKDPRVTIVEADLED